MRTRRGFLGLPGPVMAALVLVGCGGSSDSPTSTPTPTPGPAAGSLVMFDASSFDRLVLGAREPCLVMFERPT